MRAQEGMDQHTMQCRSPQLVETSMDGRILGNQDIHGNRWNIVGATSTRQVSPQRHYLHNSVYYKETSPPPYYVRCDENDILGPGASAKLMSTS